MDSKLNLRIMQLNTRNYLSLDSCRNNCSNTYGLPNISFHNNQDNKEFSPRTSLHIQKLRKHKSKFRNPKEIQSTLHELKVCNLLNGQNQTNLKKVLMKSTALTSRIFNKKLQDFQFQNSLEQRTLEKIQRSLIDRYKDQYKKSLKKSKFQNLSSILQPMAITKKQFHFKYGNINYQEQQSLFIEFAEQKLKQIKLKKQNNMDQTEAVRFIAYRKQNEYSGTQPIKYFEFRNTRKGWTPWKQSRNEDQDFTKMFA